MIFWVAFDEFLAFILYALSFFSSECLIYVKNIFPAFSRWSEIPVEIPAYIDGIHKVKQAFIWESIFPDHPYFILTLAGFRLGEEVFPIRTLSLLDEAVKWIFVCKSKATPIVACALVIPSGREKASVWRPMIVKCQGFGFPRFRFTGNFPMWIGPTSWKPCLEVFTFPCVTLNIFWNGY